MLRVSPSKGAAGRGDGSLGIIARVTVTPKGTDLSPFSQDQLNEIAERLNNRPCKVLDFETPNEVFARLVAEAKANAQKCCASG